MYHMNLNGCYESRTKEVQGIVLVLVIEPLSPPLKEERKLLHFSISVYLQAHMLQLSVIPTQSSWSSGKTEVSMHRDLGKTN